MGIYFLAIKIGDAEKKKLKLQSWPAISYLKDANLVPTYNWHYTLQFIGPLSPQELDSLKEKLTDLNWGTKFKLGIHGFGGFPDLLTCRVLFASVLRGKEQLCELAKNIRNMLDELQISYDQKPFVPHLTLLRLSSPRNLEDLKENGKMKQEIPFNVDHFSLFYSVQDKSLYEEILQIPLN